MEDTMTDTNDRLTEIRARLDAATPAPWTRFARNAAAPDEDDWYLGHDVHGPPRAQRGQIERVADAELIAHAPDDLAFLLSLVDQLQGQLDAVRAIRLADGDWSGSYRMGYRAALRDVRGVLAEGVPGDR